MVRVWVTGSVGAIFGVLGGRDPLLDALLTIMLLDLLSVVLVAFYHERLVIREAYRLVLRKLGVLLAVAVATVLDRVLLGQESSMVVRGATIGTLISLVEGASVLRNLALLGIPLPKSLERALFRVGEAGNDPATPRGE